MRRLQSNRTSLTSNLSVFVLRTSHIPAPYCGHSHRNAPNLSISTKIIGIHPNRHASRHLLASVGALFSPPKERT
jgi:hypothetical protein